MKLLISSILFCFLFNLKTNAQSNLNMDSLWGIWNNIELKDSVRIKAMNHISWSGYLFSKPDSAYTLAQLQFDLAEKNNFKIQMANAKNTQAVSFYVRGQIDKSIEYFKYCLDIKKQTTETHGIAASLNNLAIIYSRIGDYETANQYFKEALTYFYEIGDSLNISKTLNNIGNNYKDLGLYEKSINHHIKALKIQKEIDDKNSLAVSFNSLGLVYEKQGNLLYALKLYKKAIDLVTQTNNARSHAIYLNSVAHIYLSQDNIDSAQIYYEAAFTKFKLIGDKNGEADGYGNFGTLYMNKALKADHSKNYIDSSLYFFRKNIALNELLNNKAGIGLSYFNMSNIYYELNHLDSANVLLNKAKNINNQIGLHHENMKVYHLMHLIHLKTKEFKKSEQNILELMRLRDQELNTNFMVLTEDEKENYFKTMIKDYLTFNYFSLIRQSENPEIVDLAYNYALRNKGLLLKSSSALRFSILKSNDTTLINTYNDWLKLKKEIARKYSQGEPVETIEQKANDLEKELIKKSDYYNDFDKIKNQKWQDVQSNLTEKSAAIEFVRFVKPESKNQIYYAALIINKNSKHPKMVELCSEVDLQQIINQFKGNKVEYINNLYSNNNKNSLYHLLWQPLEKELNNINTIYYSPTGLLHKISFSAISTADNTQLCQKVSLHLKSSTQKVNNSHQQMHLNNISLYGGINYGGDNENQSVWNYLPATLNEVNDISLKLKKNKIKHNLFVSDNASEHNFNEHASNSTIIHIATHGYFFPDPQDIKSGLEIDSTEGEDIDFRGGVKALGLKNFVLNSNPLMRSGIALSGANNVWSTNSSNSENDGVLTAQEVSLLNLNRTELVVLSACETGLGDIKGSEGVYGLQRAFKIAGVKYIIMSLWQVPDKETAEFMSLFYKFLIKSNEIERAFKLAQSKMSKKYTPYYWAAFVLID